MQEDGTLGDDQFTFEVTTAAEKSITIDSTALGNEFSVTEVTTNVPTKDGYTFVSCETSGNGLVTADNGGNITLTNKYNRNTPVVEKGDLVLTKTFGGDITPEEIEADSITFEVKCGNKWLNADGDLVDSQTFIKLSQLTQDSSDKYKWSKTFTGVEAGEYTITETNSMVYVKDKDNNTSSIPYTLDETKSVLKGKTTVTSSTAGILNLVDHYNRPTVKLNKFSVGSTREIAGATLVLYSSDADGNKVGDYEETWTSVLDEVKEFTLEAGTYSIKETVAPEGYEKAETIFRFRVSYVNDEIRVEQISVDGAPGTYDKETGLISFYNDPVKVAPTGWLSIYVEELKTQKPVPDALVEVKDSKGNVFRIYTRKDGQIDLDRITLNGEKYTVPEEDQLTDADGKFYIRVPAGEYETKVLEVPEGYEVAVGVTGKVTVPENDKGRHEAKIVPSSENPSATTNTTTTTTAAKSVDTGDHMNVIPFIVLMIVSLISSIVVIIRKRRLRYEY